MNRLNAASSGNAFRLPLALVLACLGCRAGGDPSVAPGTFSGLHTPVVGGPVIAVGGGGTPEEVVRHGVQLAGGGEGQVLAVILAQASQREDRGVGSVEMWLEAGATEAVNLTFDDPEAAAGTLPRADVIWMSGGNQSRLLDALRQADLLDDVQAAHRRGAVVGGTSAGAAVLGAVTIGGSPDPGPYLAGAMDAEPGLALVPGTIVDQHFAERRREGRLVTALITSAAGGGPALGIGVSERTAAILSGNGFRTMGEGAVLVLDGRGASARVAEPDGRQRARGIELTVLPPGSVWPLRD